MPCRGLSLRRSTRRGACRRHPSASARVWHVRPGPARTRCPAAARQPCATARRVPGPTGFHQGGRVGKIQSGARPGQRGDHAIVSPCLSPSVLYSPVCGCCPLWLRLRLDDPSRWPPALTSFRLPLPVTAGPSDQSLPSSCRSHRWTWTFAMTLSWAGTGPQATTCAFFTSTSASGQAPHGCRWISFRPRPAPRHVVHLLRLPGPQRDHAPGGRAAPAHRRAARRHAGIPPFHQARSGQ